MSDDNNIDLTGTDLRFPDSATSESRSCSSGTFCSILCVTDTCRSGCLTGSCSSASCTGGCYLACADGCQFYISVGG